MKMYLGMVALSTVHAGVMTVFIAGGDKPAAATGIPSQNTALGTAFDDSVLTTRLRSASLADPDVKRFDLAVVTRKDEVQLSGFIANQSQLDRALATARSIEGVRSVRSDMSINK